MKTSADQSLLTEPDGVKAGGILPARRSLPTSGQTRFVSPLSSPNEWDQLVRKHPASHIFHSAAWARVLSLTYGHEPFYLTVCDQVSVGAALPVMELVSCITGKRGVSLPFSDFCPPLHSSERAYEVAVSSLLKFGYGRNWRSLRLSAPPASLASPSTFASYYAHWISLDGPEDNLFARCASSVRRAVRKAQSKGVTVERATSREALLGFYTLHCRTRRRHGLPPQPWKFFESIHREIILPGNGFVFTAVKDSRPIAATLFLLWEDKVLYKFSASDPALQNLRANNLVIWEAIRFFASRGARSLHFGRTDLSNPGLRRFKLGWGSREENLQYYEFSFRRRQWSIVRPLQPGLQNRIFRRMPLSVNRMAGAAIYPHWD